MKPLFTLLFCFLAIHCLSQAKFYPVSRDSVEHAVTDSSQSSYYPKLVKRFNEYDTTLTLNDYRLLYYGFVFQNEYSAYGDDKSKEIRDALDAGNYALAIRTCDSVLKICPITLKANYYKGYAMYKSNSSDSSYEQYRSHYYRLRDAIITSGDGLTCKTALKIIFVTDEYEIMYSYFEIKDFKGQSLVYPCDKMSVAPSDYFKADAMFFDTSESFIQMQKSMESGKKKKGKN